MSICIISFTQKGIELSRKVAEGLGTEQVSVFTKCSAVKETELPGFVRYVEKSLGEWTREQMEEKHTLLFIGASGIAVRAIAPCVVDKLQDSAVLVMDEKGEYIIPLLSGHVGGANEFAMLIASQTGATSVITTATDLQKKFAVDLFAQKNGLHIVNREGIAKVSSKVLAGKEVTMYIEPGHLAEKTVVPQGVQVTSSQGTCVDVAVTTRGDYEGADLVLIPKEYVLGMGCKRGKEEEKLGALIAKKLEETGVSLEQIYVLASINKKKDEEGLVDWCRKAKIPFVTYSAEQLLELEGDFSASDFVKSQVGVDNVCERAALRACEQGGELVCKKYAEDGMTIALAKREWRVRFDEQ